MRRIVFNDYVDASLAALLIALVLTMLAFGLKAMRDALRSEVATTRETQDGVLQTAAGLISPASRQSCAREPA